MDGSSGEVAKRVAGLEVGGGWVPGVLAPYCVSAIGEVIALCCACARNAVAGLETLVHSMSMIVMMMVMAVTMMILIVMMLEKMLVVLVMIVAKLSDGKLNQVASQCDLFEGFDRFSTCAAPTPCDTTISTMAGQRFGVSAVIAIDRFITGADLHVLLRWNGASFLLDDWLDALGKKAGHV